MRISGYNPRQVGEKDGECNNVSCRNQKAVFFDSASSKYLCRTCFLSLRASAQRSQNSRTGKPLH